MPKKRRFNQAQMRAIVGAVFTLNRLRALLRAVRFAGGDWARYSAKLLTYIDSGYTGEAPFSIFRPGNSKLPFYQFSAAPFITCPGMGACASFCYSVTAWRFPAAFFRQLQNTVLIKYAPHVIEAAFKRLPSGVDVRLYVDGDFDSLDTLNFWMNLCARRLDLRVYGYSKSWHIFLIREAAGAPWPSNYSLNLSSGSRFGDDVREKMRALPITRGEFIAVDIPRALSSLPNDVKYTDPRYKAAVRAAGAALGYTRAFVCPGKCGTCTKKTHACGDKARFSDVPILIGVH